MIIGTSVFLTSCKKFLEEDPKNFFVSNNF